MRIPIAAIAATMLLSTPTFADTYAPVPKLQGKKSGELKMRFVRYTGGTNGEMIVDVRNDGKVARTFEASGIYFVPKGDPEAAPQRLGAAGPFEIVSGKSRTAAEKLVVAPGQNKRLHLSVFCIDSHRSSPEAKHRFKIASTRMPKKLRRKISTGTSKAIRANKGDFKRAPAKAAIQSEVWRSRDEDWIKLQGERRMEKRRHKRRHHRVPRPDRTAIE